MSFFDEPLALITALATVLLFVVNWRAANAAQENARIAARAFRLSARPLVTVTWDVPHVDDDGNLFIQGTVAEVAGVQTLLHQLEYTATPVGGLPPSVGTHRFPPHKLLSGTLLTASVSLEVRVPDWTLVVGRAQIRVVDLDVTVTISVAADEMIHERWLLPASLYYQTEASSYSAVSLPATCLSRPSRGRRSRLVDPVLGAWERWWDSVS